jgi:uncharacterized protein YraI
MLKRRPHTSAVRATAVLRCGVIALGAALATGATALTAEAATAAPAAPTATPVTGTITGNGVNVRALPSLQGQVLRQLNKGAHVDVYCHLTTDVSWDRIQLAPQQWVASNYVDLAGKTVPTCASLGLGMGDGNTGVVTESGNGSKTIIKIGPIIVSNTLNNNKSH